jgi:hypothetical protein
VTIHSAVENMRRMEATNWRTEDKARRRRRPRCNRSIKDMEDNVPPANNNMKKNNTE